MKCSSLMQELTNWAIDHPQQEPSERFQRHLQNCESCRREWTLIRAWTRLLRPQNITWTPDESFFQQLTEQAMIEKQRAALTDATRRDLDLDAPGFFPLFHGTLLRWLPSLAAILLLFIPIGFWIYGSVNTIGIVDYSLGRVIAKATHSLDPRQGQPVIRNTTIQTPSGAECIIHLDSGAEVCVAPLSNLTFLDPKRVRIDKGKAFFDIPKQKSGFEVHLPSGMVRVLGTAFEISVVQGKSTVLVTRGRVEVMNQNAFVRVPQGMECVVHPLKSPGEPLPTSRMESRIRWVTRMYERQGKEELRKYYPSLAAPTPRVKP